MNAQQMKQKITNALSKSATAASPSEHDVVPPSLTAGKLYEAYVLSLVAQNLVTKEGLRLKLVNSNHVYLKSSAGPINRRYPRIDVARSGKKVAEIWTDVEFTSLSYSRGAYSSLQRGHFHELDLVMVEANTSGRPSHQRVWLGVECKNTKYEKGLLKEILGVRRELSFLSKPRPTNFQSWPATSLPADPPSCLMVYSTDHRIKNYAAPGTFFGIQFIHQRLNP